MELSRSALEKIAAAQAWDRGFYTAFYAAYETVQTSGPERDRVREEFTGLLRELQNTREGRAVWFGLLRLMHLSVTTLKAISHAEPLPVVLQNLDVSARAAEILTLASTTQLIDDLTSLMIIWQGPVRETVALFDAAVGALDLVLNHYAKADRALRWRLVAQMSLRSSRHAADTNNGKTTPT